MHSTQMQELPLATPDTNASSASNAQWQLKHGGQEACSPGARGPDKLQPVFLWHNDLRQEILPGLVTM